MIAELSGPRGREIPQYPSSVLSQLKKRVLVWTTNRDEVVVISLLG